MNSRIATECVCCGSKNLQSSPALLLPFISHRVFNWAPVEITDDWKLGPYGIKNGMAYAICNSLLCGECFHLFLDIRFDDRDMNALYDKYRDEDYVDLRDHYEPGYKVKNEQLNSGYNYLLQVEQFLESHINTTHPISVLDWGGDTGKNTPFYSSCKTLDIYDISDNPVLEKAKRVKKEELVASHYDLVVCANVLEHVSYPKESLHEIKSIMNKDTVLYIELPYENLVRTFEEQGKLETIHKSKKHWHEHVNFFTDKSVEKMVSSSGFDILELRKMKITGETSAYIFQVACKKQK